MADRFGRLDILVNSAGVLLMGPVDQFSLEDFDKTVAVNVRGVFVASKEAAAHMKDGSRGITVNNVSPGPVDTDMNRRRAISRRPCMA
jgi:3-oxoacyl-[acyl-carrier protein] reductase